METPVTDPGGTHELFIVFQGSGTGLFNLNWIEFQGRGRVGQRRAARRGHRDAR